MSENVKSAVRTLRMLELFANEEKPLTLKQITTYLEMPKSSAFMLLNTLIREHYVEEIGSGQFVLTNTLRGGGNWLGGIIEVIRAEAIKEMDNLITIFGESVVLGCLTSKNNVRIVSARQSTREMGYIVSKPNDSVMVFLHGPRDSCQHARRQSSTLSRKIRSKKAY